MPALDSEGLVKAWQVVIKEPLLPSVELSLILSELISSILSRLHAENSISWLPETLFFGHSNSCDIVWPCVDTSTNFNVISWTVNFSKMYFPTYASLSIKFSDGCRISVLSLWSSRFWRIMSDFHISLFLGSIHCTYFH